ncbi:MAG: hypothetical protein N2112_06785 [Gemmataceae bacterium]|nr:hypothetical protein [Gemmataceae bacterium]
MKHLLLGLSLLTLSIGAGCTSDTHETQRETAQKLFKTSNVIDPRKLPVGDQQAAIRADTVASAVIAANKDDTGLQPRVITIGKQEPVMYHIDTRLIVLSDGLVNQCKEDEQLAALISYELARMVTEREMQTPARRRDNDLPPTPRLTPDIAGTRVSPDMTELAEAGFHERKFPRKVDRSKEGVPDVGVLSRKYLEKVGHDPKVLEKLDPLIKESELNGIKLGY